MDIILNIAMCIALRKSDTTFCLQAHLKNDLLNCMILKLPTEQRAPAILCGHWC